MQLKIFGLISICLITLSACTTTHQDGPPKVGFNADIIPDPVPKPLAKSHYGNPHSYVALGKRYYVANTAQGYDKRGVASWYGAKFHGQRTSSGEPYDMFKLTAASRTLPIPIFAKVTNLENGRSIVVKINDRGPFLHNRLIDLSYAAAKKLRFAHKGTAFVEVKTITFNKSHAKPAQSLKLKQPEYYQVGVFSSATNALKLKSLLNKVLKKPVEITRIMVNNENLFRVEVGPLVEKAESDTLKQIVAHLGLGHPISLKT